MRWIAAKSDFCALDRNTSPCPQNQSRIPRHAAGRTLAGFDNGLRWNGRDHDGPAACAESYDPGCCEGLAVLISNWGYR